jgi:hypothetical protein
MIGVAAGLMYAAGFTASRSHEFFDAVIHVILPAFAVVVGSSARFRWREIGGVAGAYLAFLLPQWAGNAQQLAVAGSDVLWRAGIEAAIVTAWFGWLSMQRSPIARGVQLISVLVLIPLLLSRV